MKRIKTYILFTYLAIQLAVPGYAVSNTRDAAESVWTLKKPSYSIQILKKGFRYSILKPDNSPLLQAHASSGLLLLNSAIADARLVSQDAGSAEFSVTNDIGVRATVRFTLSDNYFKMSVRYADAKPISGSIVARTKGLAPAFGLADNAGFREPYDAELTGFLDKEFGAKSVQARESRLVSNFVVFPKQGLACINLEPDRKIVKVDKDELVQGSFNRSEMPAMYYFIGSVKQIYADYLRVRNQEGYKVYLPKYAWFGVGWEAWGALVWNTNYQTVTQDVDHYLAEGFPLSWMVVGSGFWPSNEPKHFTTTSLVRGIQ
jgi:hypothetical protein